MNEKKVSKKELLTCLGIIFLLIFSYGVGLVYASWTSPETSYLVENTGGINDPAEISSANNQIFWDNASDRWYILYSEDSASSDFYLKYSYSDSGDITTWNNGGTVGNKIRDTGTTGVPHIGYRYSWAYDIENQLGHMAVYRDPTMSGNEGIWYRNFTISGGGSLTFGNEVKVASTLEYGSIDLALTHDYRPMISYGGMASWDYDYHSFVMISDSIDGYNGSWDVVEFAPQYIRGTSSLFPAGNNACVIIVANSETANPLRAFYIDFGSTTNSSGQGTVFSDGSLERDTIGSAYVVYYGISYNTTHGVITYCDSSTYEGQAFTFDFATMTRSSESTISDWGLSGQAIAWNGATIHDNEFFVTAVTSGDVGAVNKTIWGNEYHDPLYDGYFNISATDHILENYTTAGANWHQNPMTTSRSTDDSGVCLIGFYYTNSLYVTYWTVSGEYGEAPAPPEELIPWAQAGIFIGLVGAFMCVAGPTWMLMIITRSWDNIAVGLGYGFCVTLIGMGLIAVWLLD